jgi:hypothetical protein
MPKNKTSVRIARNVPRAKISGLVRSTIEFREASKSLAAGKSIEFTFPVIPELKNSEMAFLAALRRKFRHTHKIYARNGVIYCLSTENGAKP